MEPAPRLRYRAGMRVLPALALAVALAACGSSHSASNPDAPGSGSGADGSGGGGSGDGSGGGGPGTVSLTLTNRPNDAAMFSFLVAYQDGSGPWTLAPAPTGDTYTFPINSPVYSVAWTCIGTAAGAGGMTQVRQVSLASFAVAERNSLTMDVPARCTDRISRVALTGNVTGANGGFYLITAGGRTTFAQNGAYSLEVPPGTYDVFALRAGPGSGAGQLVVDQAAVVRGVAVTAATTQDVDVTTAQPTQSFPVTVTNATNARIQATTTLYTANGSAPPLVVQNTMPLQTEALAAAQAASGDVYQQAVQVTDTATGDSQTVESWTGSPAAQDVTPPAAQGGAIATVPVSTPYPEIKTTWASYAGATGYAWIATQPLSAQQCGGQTGCAVVWSALLSPGVTGSMPAYQMPDLSGLTGWSTSFQLVPGANVNGRLDAFTSSLGASDFPPVTPAASGTQRTTAEGRWTATP